VEAVRGVDLSVGDGEIFGFLGPNGAGKTTTISILTTTLAKSSGTVTIAGHDLDREATQVRRNIGIIFQNPSLDQHLSGEENIRLHVALYGIHGYRPFYRLMPAEYRARIERLAAVLDRRPVRGVHRRRHDPVRSLRSESIAADTRNASQERKIRQDMDRDQFRP